MMKTKTTLTGRIVAMIIAIVMVLGVMPTFSIAANSADPRTVDPATHNNYENIFYEVGGVLTTEMAGGVWTDKSVFTKASELSNLVTMDDEDNNFLVALSAIAANKEIIGYSSIPTDTVFVIDVSTSMSSTSLSQMTTAVNDAIKELYKTSGHNRISVIAYDGSVQTLLPLDRYTAGTGGDFLTFYDGRWEGDDTISVANGVKNKAGSTVTGTKEQYQNGTYIQGAIWAAMEELLKADTVIPAGEIQGGSSRMPIVVLMSDGDPNRIDYDYTDVGNYNSSVGNSSNRVTFLTMLTAAYAKSQITAHYGGNEGHNALFYTLGYDVANSNHARTVLNPAEMASPFDGYATAYLNARVNSTVTLGTGRNAFSVTKVSGIDSLIYSDKYFSAAEGNINSAFDSIVQEIVIQSKYYATHFEANPDFDGYLVFEDTIGDYMNAVGIKGILYGNTFFTGETLAGKINTTDLGTIQSPTEFGIKFRDSVKTRLGISDNTTAFDLITQAYNAGQLGMHNGTWHNEIRWYADADNRYLGHWNEGVTSTPANAVYKNESHGYLGTITDGIASSDMMFMSVMIQTNIETGEEKILWRIPASLMPMITYNVSFTGTSVEDADDVELTVDRNVPVRLVYEVALDPLVNERSVNEIMKGDLNSAKYKNGDGWKFWVNHFDKSAPSHDDHISTTAEFKPSVQNEHYYYVEDTPIYIKDGNTYTQVTDAAHNFDTTANEYVHLMYEFSTASLNSIKHYEPITAASLNNKKYENGCWYIEQGTIYKHIRSEDVVEKTQNLTESIEFSHNAFVLNNNDVLHKVGNNGLYELISATGIKLSKTIDGGSVVPETFKFEIAFNANLPENEYPTVLADLNESIGTEGTVQVTDGNKIVVELQSGKTLWITDLPAGVSYEIKEIGTNFDYAVKSVSVNGVAQNGITAKGTIAQHQIDDVDFVNALADKGALNVTKEVVHPLGLDYEIPAAHTFVAKVTFTKGGAALADFPVTVVTTSGNTDINTTALGEVEISLKDGETVQIKGVPEGTEYVVEELHIANGFALTTDAAALEGTINIGTSNVTLVNTYTPAPVSADVTVEVTKYLDGRDWNANEEFTFTLKGARPDTPSNFVTIATIKATAEGVKVQKVLNETYDKVGTYHYILTEDSLATANGITYDTEERRFHVYVVDENMDGNLEIKSAENVMNTTVTGDAANGITVSTRFDNSYAVYTSTPVTITVEKAMDTAGGTHALNGFKFGLYPVGTTEVIESTVTDTNGNARFEITFSPESAGSVFEYELKEINNAIPGITYDNTVYNVKVEIIDDLDGTSSSKVTITDALGNPVTTPTFTNRYTPEAGYTTLDATKTLVGRTLTNGEFSFELVNGANQVVQTKKNSADGVVLFDPIALTSAGVHTYTVREVAGTDASVTYDDTVYTVKITVIQDGSVYRETDVEYFIGTTEVNGIEFENLYTAKATQTQITAEKELVGRTLANGEFEFELYDEAGNLLQTKKNVGKDVTFDSVPLATAGIHKFTVKEKVGTLAGITYDTAEYLVTVTVTDNGTGQLNVTDKTVTKNGQAVTTIKFTNTYFASATEGEIPVKKILNGKTLEDGEFGFVLKNARTGDTIATVRNNASGEFKFEHIPFNFAGDHFFEIHEINENKTGYTYDSAIYAIKVVVVDNGDGKLRFDNAQTVIAKDGTPATEIVFTNSYGAVASYGETLTGMKYLNGKTLEDGEFSFELVDSTGTPVQRVTNLADGTITFADITFDAAGTHTYTVREVVGTVEGMTYDTNVYTVEFDVEDVGGRFTVVDKRITLAGNPATIVFNNSYVAPIVEATPIAVYLNIQKVLENNTTRQMGLGGFEFKLVSDLAVVNTSVFSNKDGEAKLELAFTEYNDGGSYTYELYEVNTAIPGMKYSDKVYEIRVDVEKTEYNTIDATFYVDGVKTEIEDLNFEFVNVYGQSEEKPTGGATTGGDLAGLVTAGAMLGSVIAVAAVLCRKTN